MFSLLRYGWNTRTFAQLFSYWVCVCEWLSVHVVWVIVLVRLRLCNYVFGCGCECVSECVNISIFGCSEVILFTAVWSYMNNACMYNYCAKDEWFEVLNLRQICTPVTFWQYILFICSALCKSHPWSCCTPVQCHCLLIFLFFFSPGFCIQVFSVADSTALYLWACVNNWLHLYDLL